MDIASAVSRIKQALSRRDYDASLTHFHFKNKSVYASNGAMTASCPVDQEGEHVVPAQGLEKAFSIFGTSAEYLWEEKTLTVKQGRKKMTIQLLEPQTVHLLEPVPPILHTALSKDFTAGLRLVRPFLSEDATRPWALTAWLRLASDGRFVLTATNNITVVNVDAGDCFPTGTDVQIPNFAIDFILAREQNLKWMGIDANKVSFYFDDDSILTTSLFQAKMPDLVSNLIDSKVLEADAFEVTSEWKSAYESVVAISPDEIFLGPTSMRSGRLQVEMVAEVPTPAPRDQAKLESVFCPKFLTPVLDVATHIDFAAYPQACIFKGPRVFGLTVGKSV